MFFKLLKKKKEGEINQINKEIQIGDRFAVKYDSLGACIYVLVDHPYYSGYIKESVAPIAFENYKDLTTVVEYIGDDQYLDLVSGVIFSKEVCIDDLLDTVTEEYSNKAKKVRDNLVSHPIGFRYKNELTAEVKKDIMDNTMPKKDEITSSLLEIEKLTREKVLTVYNNINEAKLLEYRLKAEEEERKRIEIERKEQEKRDRIRIAEEKRLAHEKLKAEVDPKFDEMFPKTLIKK